VQIGNIYVTITLWLILEYEDTGGVNHFEKWFNKLDAHAAAKVTTYLTRMSNGNFSNAKGVSKGVYECVIDYWPGYRVYFGKDGEKLVIVLAGSSKKRQQKVINKAHELWAEYKKVKAKKGNVKRGN